MLSEKTKKWIESARRRTGESYKYLLPFFSSDTEKREQGRNTILRILEKNPDLLDIFPEEYFDDLFDE